MILIKSIVMIATISLGSESSYFTTEEFNGTLQECKEYSRSQPKGRHQCYVIDIDHVAFF